jgi:hypothetical protein
MGEAYKGIWWGGMKEGSIGRHEDRWRIII